MSSTLVLLAWAALQGGGASVIQVDAGRGPVDVRIPAGQSAGELAPLVLLLHGYVQQPDSIEQTLDLVPWLDSYGFVYARPTGQQDAFGAHYWNASSACCDFSHADPDDSGYLRALVEAIQQQADIDPRRIYAAGHSNGGFMAHRLACEHADLFAGVVSIAGAIETHPFTCDPTEPVSILEIHGVNDALIDYGGGLFFGHPYPSVSETGQRWSQALGCGFPVTSQLTLDLALDVPGAETTVDTYFGCPTNGAFESWTMHGVGHILTPTAEVAPLVLEWMLLHAKAGLDTTAFCSPAPANVSGLPGRIRATGLDTLQRNSFGLVAEDLPANTFGLFLGARGAIHAQLPGDVHAPLCVGPTIARLGASVLATGPNGAFSLALDLRAIPPVAPQGVVTGEMWYFQAWHRDGAGSSLSDALAVRFR
ncbi:MAG: PHB depolymerase family esterase [Planctomycetota bacterium]